MEMKMHLVRMGKALLVSIVISIILLFLMAFVLYKADLSGLAENVMVIIIYLAASLMGGFLLGHREKQRKFLWGAAFGGIYFLLLLLLAVVSEGTVKGVLDWGERIRAMFVCVLGGMVGGMLS